MEADTKVLEPEALSASVGSVEVSLNHLGLGEVRVDGKQMKHVRRVVIDAEAGQVPRVTLEIIPIPSAADAPLVVEAPCPT